MMKESLCTMYGVTDKMYIINIRKSYINNNLLYVYEIQRSHIKN